MAAKKANPETRSSRLGARFYYRGEDWHRMHGTDSRGRFGRTREQERLFKAGKRRCSRCKKVKGLRRFRSNWVRNKKRYLSRCKLCERQDKQEGYRRNSPRGTAGYSRQYYAELKAQVIKAYGSACACCGEAEPKFLSIDHKDGGGSAHRSKVTHGVSGGPFYCWLRRNGFPQKDFQLLCNNCNVAKHRYGICPHQEKRNAYEKIIAEHQILS